MATRSNRIVLGAHLVLGIAVLASISLYPPAQGRILMIPLLDRDANATARVALLAEARLLGRGPLPGSMVVIGDRAQIAAGLHAWDMLLVAAPPAGCGADARAVAA